MREVEINATTADPVAVAMGAGDRPARRSLVSQWRFDDDDGHLIDLSPSFRFQ